MVDNYVAPLLTDLYQITMVYGYWKSGKSEETAVFDLFFRRNPFGGEFTIFAGLSDCLQFIEKFHFTDEDIDYLRTILPKTVESEFYDYLRTLDTSQVELYSISEGSCVFPRVPLITVVGPLPIAQILETTLLNLVNFASLVTTNAARFRLACGHKKKLLEFGIRRAQGPNGAMSASRYCYMGGFDATSNVLAGKLWGIPVAGTHAHSFVCSFKSLDDIRDRRLVHSDGSRVDDFVDEVQRQLDTVKSLLDDVAPNDGELAAFIQYARAFPENCLLLVDTYDIQKTGVPSACAVALALDRFGYRMKGIRIDSGDLAYHSRRARQAFITLADRLQQPWMKELTIVASNDINEDTLNSFAQQKHEIDSFGIGTHLVTCQKQPALGCVYKLVELNGIACLKLSMDTEKLTLPGRKEAYRIFGQQNQALVDVMTLPDEPAPKVDERLLIHHPFDGKKRANVSPTKVEKLRQCYWAKGKLQRQLPDLEQMRQRVHESLLQMREDHIRSLNPTPYKVSVTHAMYTFTQELWCRFAPVGELK